MATFRPSPNPNPSLTHHNTLMEATPLPSHLDTTPLLLPPTILPHRLLPQPQPSHTTTGHLVMVPHQRLPATQLVGSVARTAGGLVLEEGLKHEEKIPDRPFPLHWRGLGTGTGAQLNKGTTSVLMKRRLKEGEGQRGGGGVASWMGFFRRQLLLLPPSHARLVGAGFRPPPFPLSLSPPSPRDASPSLLLPLFSVLSVRRQEKREEKASSSSSDATRQCDASLQLPSSLLLLPDDASSPSLYFFSREQTTSS
ncbi:hypothetical protein ZIOFF_009482 [Zingiber officinale]|uniref:Uncharacterized protein n=1 Tax=Zingiber officinale TaxID=94328 RepID=A0A8J5HHR5_ZINOF|nr:hypothetical protein ZIOFF_009482 [Zingiber officinale]